MKKLFVASHTGKNRIEKWLVAQVVDTADREKLKSNIRKALSWREPEEPRYDRNHDVNYGPFTDEYELSEEAYNAILRKFPDGNITPCEKWFDVLCDLGLTNDCDAHRFEIEKQN